MSVFLDKLTEALELPELPEKDQWYGRDREEIERAQDALGQASTRINSLYDSKPRDLDPDEIERAGNTLDTAEELIGELGGNYDYQNYYARAWESRVRSLRTRLMIIRTKYSRSLETPKEYWKI